MGGSNFSPSSGRMIDSEGAIVNIVDKIKAIEKAITEEGIALKEVENKLDTLITLIGEGLVNID